jgi:hypothetical protein
MTGAHREDWIRCRPWIEAALQYADGAYVIEDIEDAILAGDMMLIAGPDFGMVVEILPFPRFSALNVILAGGDLDGIKSTDPLLCNLARGHGCTRVYLSGRLGWVRALAPLGYGNIGVTASKVV